MSKQEPTDPASGPPAEGLGFSALSMNEIAPAVTAEPSEAGKRAGHLWLVIIVALALIGGGAWLIRNTLNVPPPEAVQERLRTAVKASAYGQKGVVLDASFVTGDTVRVEFGSYLNTREEKDRKSIRKAMAEVMTLLAKVITEEQGTGEGSEPSRDLFLVGYQGERKMADAHHLHQGAVTARSQGHQGQVDMVINVEHGEDDPPMIDAQERDTRPGGLEGLQAPVGGVQGRN
jgi:hypothetical protein